MRLEPHVAQLDADPRGPFPNPDECQHPHGLLAWGGDLSPARLIEAYRQGIFPWFETGSPPLWWSPDPRMVFSTDRFHISRSLRRTLKQPRWQVTLDQAFAKVITACAAVRAEGIGTWITPSMKAAYVRLHGLGIAHSIEVWEEEELVGGLYGVSMGHVFYAESKFHIRTDASKVALAYLMRLMTQWSYALVDCQIKNPHLQRLGAYEISRTQFRAIIRQGLHSAPKHAAQQAGHWRDLSTDLDVGVGW